MESLKHFNKKLLAFFVFLLLTSAIIEGGDKPRVRPAKWAQPVIGTSLNNFYIIDSLLYRSSQPDGEDFILVEKYGIKEILNLRHYHSDDRKAKGTGLILHRVKMDAASIKLSDVIEAMKIIKNAEGPVLIHCKHGSDRTGLISAMYRIVFQNWIKEEAIDELVNGGYGFHTMYDGIIDFIKQTNIDEIKQQVFKVQ